MNRTCLSYKKVTPLAVKLENSKQSFYGNY